MENDPLRLVFLLGYKVYQNKVVKIVLKFLLLLNIAVAGLHLFFFVVHPQDFQLVKYGCLFLQIVWGILGIAVLLYKDNLVEDVMGSIEWWAFHTIDKDTQMKITQEASICKRLVITNVVVGLVWATTMVVPSRNEDEHSLPAVLLKRLFPDEWFYLHFAFCLTFYPTVLTMLAHGFQVIYALKHIQFQFNMFNSLVKSIDHKLVLLQSKMLLNRNGQDEIELRLKVLIKRHHDFLRWKNRILSEMGNLIVPFSIGGFLVGMAIAFGFLQAANDPSPVVFLRALVYSINAFSLGCSILNSGQCVEDESENIYTSLLLTKWYQWDLKNQKLYLVIVGNSMGTIKVRFTDEVVMNHRLGMAICKTVFSGFSVFYNVQ